MKSIIRLKMSLEEGEYSMKQETIDKLEKEYSSTYKGRSSVVKYRYEYNRVNVNLYYDKFDINSPQLSAILVYKDNNTDSTDYYYTSLNILNTKIDKQYLIDIPESILKRIESPNYKLDDFFDSIDDHILSTKKPYITSYDKDKIFYFTINNKTRVNRKDLPFLSGFRRTRMQDATLDMLAAKFCIDRRILQKLQDRGITLVRTSDPFKRKNIVAVLDGTGITF